MKVWLRLRCLGWSVTLLDRPAARCTFQPAFTAATNLFKDRGVSHVQLLYDRDTNRMAFKPCESTEEGAYPLRPKDTCCQVSAQSFVGFYGIRFGKKSTTYPAEWDDESGMLIVDLESSGLSWRFSDSLRVTEL